MEILTNGVFWYGVLTGVLGFLTMSFLLMWLVTIDGKKVD